MAMSKIVHWYAYVLRKEDGHVLRRALEFEVEGERKNGRAEKMMEQSGEEEGIKGSVSKKNVLCGLR